MTTKELAKDIGREGYIPFEKYGVRINVKVLDVKMSYGMKRFLVTPLSGEGEVWIQNIQFDEKK